MKSVAINTGAADADQHHRRRNHPGFECRRKNERATRAAEGEHQGRRALRTEPVKRYANGELGQGECNEECARGKRQLRLGRAKLGRQGRRQHREK